ncbi:CDP-glycerol glycerophosphotransferase family protein [Candidatus Saccharibacteria bacterium]|nr:CDP-glycerol glycerophosphotransferase family protein [Candidatus Saccharibacteria bacterium]
MPSKQSKQASHDPTSPLVVEFNAGVLHLEYKTPRQYATDVLDVDTTRAPDNRVQNTGLEVRSYRLKDKVHLVQTLSEVETLVVFSEGNLVKYYRHTDVRTHPLTRLLVAKSKTYFHLTKRGLRLVYACFIENKYNLPIKQTYLVIGDEYSKRKDFPIYPDFPPKVELLQKAIFTDFIPLMPLLQGEPAINAKIGVSIDLDGTTLAKLHLVKGSRRLESKGKRWFYAPIGRTHRNGYSIFVRRNNQAGLNLVRRPLSDTEKMFRFRFYESLPVSFLLFHTAHVVRRLSDRTVNVYYEKEANQIEEGTINLFRKARDHSKSKNFFILNSWAKDFPSLRKEQGILPNFSLKSYWYLYRANNLIATETANHVNVVRSDNKYMKCASYSQRFIFLQHGVTYMKAHEKNTSFTRNREFEPNLMIVNSLKERDVVSSMLELEEERLLNTGMLIFDGIEYGHITQKSPDIVTIMLTWKAYEEHIKDATTTSYYKTVTALYDTISKLIDKKNIRIVIHPKVKELMAQTDMADAMWQGTIAEVLAETKLLITDYSSVCYNVFYQGGAVIYYQPDLEQYEQANGKLLPRDDEYTGHRIFTEKEVKKLVQQNITDGKIGMSGLRTKQHIANYLSINEHHDGKNCERIFDKLMELGII